MTANGGEYRMRSPMTMIIMIIMIISVMKVE